MTSLATPRFGVCTVQILASSSRSKIGLFHNKIRALEVPSCLSSILNGTYMSVQVQAVYSETSPCCPRVPQIFIRFRSNMRSAKHSA